jgi:hypothetical protein
MPPPPPQVTALLDARPNYNVGADYIDDCFIVCGVCVGG